MRNRVLRVSLGLGLSLVAACFSSTDDGDRPDAGDPDGGSEPVCADGDGDGWGEGPDCQGADCDDDDAAVHAGCGDCRDGDTGSCYDGAPVTDGVGVCHPGEHECVDGSWGPCLGQVQPVDESCNDADDDCDGDVDEGATSTCGDCDPGCHLTCVGAGCAQAFELGAGAVLTAEGAVGPGPDGADIARHVVWLSGGDDGMVYQVDTSTFEVLGAYASGVRSSIYWTIVTDTWGNAFVAQGGSRLNDPSGFLRIDTSDCVDANGDGVVTTSSGQHDALPPGEDDCVRWQSEVQLNSPPAMALDPDGRLWVAVAGSEVAPFDPETGDSAGDAIHLESEAYSLLAVADGLWVGRSGTLCFVDTETLEPSCEPVGRDMLSELELADDGSILSLYPLSRRDSVSGELTMFFDLVSDIAVDGRGHVWAQAVGDQGRISGVLYRFDDDLSAFEQFDLPFASRHVFVDSDQQVWTESVLPGVAAVYDPDTGEHLATLLDDCRGGNGCVEPYELNGDPGGARFRHAFPDLYERAEAGAVIEAACAPGERRSWTAVAWQTSGSGALLLEGRAAPTREALRIAPWSVHVLTPPAEGSAQLGLAFGAPDAFAEVRTRFREPDARLDRVDLRWRCDP